MLAAEIAASPREGSCPRARCVRASRARRTSRPAAAGRKRSPRCRGRTRMRGQPEHVVDHPARQRRDETRQHDETPALGVDGGKCPAPVRPLLDLPLECVVQPGAREQERERCADRRADDRRRDRGEPEHRAADRIEREARHETERAEREHEREQRKARESRALPILCAKARSCSAKRCLLPVLPP